MKAVRKEDFNTKKIIRGRENISEERNTKEIEQRRENIDNRNTLGDAIWTRTSETGVTRRHGKCQLPVLQGLEMLLRICKQTMHC